MSNFRYERWLEKTFSSDVTHQNLDLPPSQLDATKLQRIKKINPHQTSYAYATFEGGSARALEKETTE